ncbi:hypothetical protein KI387_025546, partial [Taxus chinensis]
MDVRSIGGPRVWILTMASRHGPKRYWDICKVVYKVIQDSDTRVGYMETILGLLDMGQPGFSPGGAKTEQGGQGP